MRVRVSTRLAAPPGWVVEQLQSTAVFRHITAPLMRFAPVKGAAWPATWAPGEMSLRLRLFGLLPMGSQQVRISIEPSPAGSDWPTLRDNGDGTLMRRWDHRITVHPLPGGDTWYTDDIEVQARYLPWLMTPLSAAFAQVFYRHRQRRWRAWVTQRLPTQAQTPHDGSAAAAEARSHQRRAFEYLLQCFARTLDEPHAPASLRWRYLEAAHVLGQTQLALHWRSHGAMLGHALRLRDGGEALGQLARLALTPLGHLLGRLPQGNSGRSHVSAFEPMVPAAEVRALIAQALQATRAGAESHRA